MGLVSVIHMSAASEVSADEASRSSAVDHRAEAGQEVGDANNAANRIADHVMTLGDISGCVGLLSGHLNLPVSAGGFRPVGSIIQTVIPMSIPQRYFF